MMTTTNKSNESLVFAIWTTAWGPMAAIASEKGLRRVVLPHYQLKDLHDVMEWEHPDARQDDAAGIFHRVIALARDYYNARPADFAEIACDAAADNTFSGKVLSACRAIPYGQTLTYSSLAYKIGSAHSARAVGAALGRNPLPLVIPCHRVINTSGGMSGFSAPGGIEVKKRMLEMEKRVRGEVRG